MSEAKVETKPHQIEAVLFAFKSPLSKGAILADEVGLGKTIEVGIVISQKWADDVKKSIELELKNLDMDIKLKKAEARKLLKQEDKLNMQKEIGKEKK